VEPFVIDIDDDPQRNVMKATHLENRFSLGSDICSTAEDNGTHLPIICPRKEKLGERTQ
jgi:hypothetical protein